MQNNYNQPQGTSRYPVKPDNHLVWAILCTICCCLPFGIVSIVYAAKVNGLWAAQQYDAAVQASIDARKWAIIGTVTGIIINVLYFIWYALLGGATLLMGLS